MTFVLFFQLSKGQKDRENKSSIEMNSFVILRNHLYTLVLISIS